MSGVIYAVIVAMWAAFLVPMWLRRHDERAAEVRSIDKFSTAMRVLARRSMSDGRPEGTVPIAQRASKEATVVIKRHSATTMTASDSIGVRITDYEEFDTYVKIPEPARARAVRAATTGFRRFRRTSETARSRPHTSLAIRRRRVLVALVALTVVFAVVAQVRSLSMIIPVVPGLLTVAYLAHLRIQARRAAEIARVRRAGSAPRIRAEVPTGSLAVRPAATRADEATSRSRYAATAAVVQPVVPPLSVAEHAAAGADGDADAHADTDGFSGPRVSWQPVRVPTPTYVTAAKATRPTRNIDLTAPGAWTSGRLVSDAVAAAARAVGERPAAADDERADDDTSDQLRAVGD